MSDAGPELQSLAERLFAAGRAERPGTALGRRLSLIGPLAGSAKRDADGGSARNVERRGRVTRWWLAAIVLVSAAGLWPFVQQTSTPILISPDRTAARAAPMVMAPVPPATTSEQAEPTGKSSTPQAVTVPRVLRRTAPKQPLKTEHRLAVQPHAPPAPPEAPRVTSAKPRDPEPSSTPASSPAPSRLLAELELLKQARTALRSGNGTRAIELLDRRERGGSELEAEATLLRIEALSSLGRRREASDLAVAFVKANPNSALGDRAKSFILSATAAP